MREIEQLTLSTPAARYERVDHSRAISRTPPVLWLNLVCLDAPIVALTWQWFFARSFHVSLGSGSRLALFLTAWLIYLADRLADTWKIYGNEPLSRRQQFCRRYQIAFFVSIALLAGIDLWIIVRMLDHATIGIGTVLGAISILYLSINYWLGKIWRFVPVKEICIGSLFALGTVAALIPRIHPSTEFVESFVLFAALCSLNCISIAMWERELDRAQRKNSIATRWHGTRSAFRLSAIILAGVAVSFAKTEPALFGCLATSGVLLVLLDWAGEVIARDERTALADLVLLTPLLLLPFMIA